MNTEKKEFERWSSWIKNHLSESNYRKLIIMFVSSTLNNYGNAFTNGAGAL